MIRDILDTVEAKATYGKKRKLRTASENMQHAQIKLERVLKNPRNSHHVLNNLYSAAASLVKAIADLEIEDQKN